MVVVVARAVAGFVQVAEVGYDVFSMADLRRALLHGEKFNIDVESGGEAAPKLLRCAEDGCVLKG